MDRLLGRLNQTIRRIRSARQPRVEPIYLTDQEFGRIKLIRNQGRLLRLNIRTNGEIVVSAPHLASQATAKSFVDDNREYLRSMISRLGTQRHFNDGDLIGRHHRLVIKTGVRSGVRVGDRQAVVTITDNTTRLQRDQLVRQAVAKALKHEASRYLPKRLQYFATKYSYHYDRIRLTFAKSRWGSCSSNGTISLNVALMTLPDELIDYVLLHELAHTIQMNHSPAFWRQVEQTLPSAQALRRRLREYSPYI